MNKLQHLQYLNFRKPSRYADNITAIQAKPSLDLNFARNKSLMDNVTGNNLVTFTRASSGTFVNSNGVLQSAPVNFIRNNTMQGAVAGTPGTLPTNWVVTNLGTLSQQIVGVGTISGVNYIDWRISGTSSTSSVTLAFEPTTQIPALSGQAWTHSCFIARVAGSTTNIAYGGLGIYERTSAGVLVTANNAPINSANSTTFTRQVYSATLSGGATVANVQPLIVLSITSGAAINITLRIGLPQLELGSSATEIIRTTGTINSAPRFDHNPLTGESLGLLVEESRTNLWTYSGDFANAAWIKVRSSITSNTIVAPDGTLTGDKLIASTDAGTTHFVRQDVSVTSGTSYTQTIYAKAGEYTQIYMGFDTDNSAFAGGSIIFTLTGNGIAGTPSGTLTSNSITPVGNGWYRCQITATATATATGIFRIQSATGDTNGFTGDGTSGIYIWGAQLEAGAFPTSYIPTTTATVTRSADVVSVNTLTPWFNASEGTLYVEGSSSNLARAMAVIDDGSFNNRYQAAIASGYTPNFAAVSGGAVSADIYTSALTQSSNVKLAGAYRVNDFALSANGSAVVTDTSGALPVGLTTLRLGAYSTGGILCGTIRRLTYFPQRLSNANLQRITQ
jgi:hypothetical protein